MTPADGHYSSPPERAVLDGVPYMGPHMSKVLGDGGARRAPEGVPSWVTVYSYSQVEPPTWNSRYCTLIAASGKGINQSANSSQAAAVARLAVAARIPLRMSVSFPDKPGYSACANRARGTAISRPPSVISR